MHCQHHTDTLAEAHLYTNEEHLPCQCHLVSSHLDTNSYMNYESYILFTGTAVVQLQPPFEAYCGNLLQVHCSIACFAHCS